VNSASKERAQLGFELQVPCQMHAEGYKQ
jgi:hypothetical protein